MNHAPFETKQLRAMDDATLAALIRVLDTRTRADQSTLQAARRENRRRKRQQKMEQTNEQEGKISRD